MKPVNFPEALAKLGFYATVAYVVKVLYVDQHKKDI